MSGYKDRKSLTDQELVEECRDGSRAAFDLLVDRHSGRLYQVAFGLLGNREDAEEVVQDAFIRAFRSLAGFRGESGFATWINRIVVNLARNRYHWNRRRGSNLNISISDRPHGLDDDRDQEDLKIPDDKLSPEQLIGRAELEQTVLRGFDALPDKLRETLVLRHVEDMSYEKIAAVLACKVGTVKSRLARGREMLRELLCGRGDDSLK